MELTTLPINLVHAHVDTIPCRVLVDSGAAVNVQTAQTATFIAVCVNHHIQSDRNEGMQHFRQQTRRR
jgi:hypothetical protein